MLPLKKPILCCVCRNMYFHLVSVGKTAYECVSLCVYVHSKSQFTCLSVLSARPMRASLAQQSPAGSRRKSGRKSGKEEEEEKEECGGEFHSSLPDREARLQLSPAHLPPPLPPPLLPVAACVPPALDTKAFSALAFNSVQIMGHSFGSLQTAHNYHCCVLSQSKQSINHSPWQRKM